MLNLNMLRKKNILQPPMMASPSMAGGPGDEEDNTDEQDNTDETGDDTGDESDNEFVPQVPQVQSTPDKNTFQKLLGNAVNTPQGPLSQKLTDYLNKPAPAEEDYKPGGINRLAAILGGASEGYQRGAGAGMKVARSTLDEPYKSAMNKYALEGNRLEKGAELESKNLGRAASFAKTSMVGEHNERVDETNKLKALAQDRHWTAQDSKAAQAGATKGWNHYVNTDTGHLVFTRPKADGTLETIDGGKTGESIPEKSKRILSEKQATEGMIGKRIKDTQDNNALNTQMENNRKAGLSITEAAVKEQNKPIKPEKDLLPAQEAQQAKLNMVKIVGKYGDKVKDYFEFDDKGNPVRLKPSDPDDQGYKDIYKAIYPSKKKK